ncbi:Fic family protein [Pedobacter sp. L105]|uniref:Fic family protein n=1 Tax=Pedobacter sp. L105 TaxID=1641871 RepID=UPI00131C4A67|nr:Fic family protein [Pedobacter sp. L105]
MDLIKLIDKCNSLGINDVMDYNNFNYTTIVYHSIQIEGSTLTELETQALINEGFTPKGRPLMETLTVTDHYAALKFALKQAFLKRKITLDLIKDINSVVVKNTGNLYNTIYGTTDQVKGLFRKEDITDGFTFFPGFDKVESLSADMVIKINEIMKDPLTVSDQINLSFDAHFMLFGIHPFYDGNGRTSRLLMNYIQAFYNLPLSVVHYNAKAAYIQAIISTREKNDITIFRDFMSNEYEILLKHEIDKFEQMNKH